MWHGRLVSAGYNAFIPLIAILLSLTTVAVLLRASGADPVTAYGSMINAAFGSSFSLSTTLLKTIPRLLAALGIALALRAGLWNIGAEGQIYVGAVATTAVALFGPHLAFPFAPLLAMAGGALAGAAWAAIPGMLRATRGISEVITSLMLVYVAIQLTNYLVEGPWLIPGSTFPESDLVPSGAILPVLWSGTLLNAGAIVAALAVIVAWVLMDLTTFGLRLRALGGNDRAAHLAGVRTAMMIVLALALSGAFAGLAGSIEVLGDRGRLVESFSPGYGFDAIAIALLGRLQPVSIVAAALLFGALDAGGAGLQTAAIGVSSSIVQITEGLVVVYLLIGLGIAQTISRRRRAREVLAAARQDEEASASPALVDAVRR